MGAAASIPLAAATGGLSLPAAGILAAATGGLSLPATGILGVVGGCHIGAGGSPKAAALASGLEAAEVSDGIDSIEKAAEAVMRYLLLVAVASSACEKAKVKVKEHAAAFVKDRVVKPVRDKASSAMDRLDRAASSAFEWLRAAAAVVPDRVIKMARHLRGDKQADAARQELDRAAAADEDAGHDVLSTASARIAGFGQLQNVKALPPPPSSSAIVSATAPGGGALAFLRSVVMAAGRAAQLASEMMSLIETVVGVLGDSIPEDARACIWVVVSAVGIGLEVIAAATAKDA